MVVSKIDMIGKNFLGFFYHFFGSLVFLYVTFREVLKIKFSSLSSVLSIVVAQIFFTGFQALPLISFIALAVGSIVVIQSIAQLSVLGSQEIMGKILVVTIVRELGPLLTALIVIARSGTAVASELGNMQVNKEIDALRILGISPFSFVIFPRIIGGVVSLVCLSFYFNIISFLGGFFVANQLSDLTFSFYAEVLSYSLDPSDLILNLLKNVISGFIIFTISCEEGLKVTAGPHEVPMATTRAVVFSIVSVMAYNLGMTALTYAKEIIS